MIERGEFAEGFDALVVGRDKHGPLWDRKKVVEFAAADLAVGRSLDKRRKNVAVDIEKATSVAEQAIDEFDHILGRLANQHTQIEAGSRAASSKVRKAANELAEGLARIEKQANFDRLERYVGLLERAASAMNTMAQLQADGKLERIAGALK